MAKLKMVYFPDDRLREPNQTVLKFDKELEKLAADMLETMYAENGYGLAAPQIGQNLKLIVVDTSPERNRPQILANPQILESTGTLLSEEGCLSIPGFREKIRRFASVKVRAQNLRGEEITITAEELQGRCLQHEIDHLEGILFVDHLSPVKKKIFTSWFKKHSPLGKHTLDEED